MNITRRSKAPPHRGAVIPNRQTASHGRPNFTDKEMNEMTKRRITMLLCVAVLTMCMASPPPAFAADRSAACYYPIEVESYTAGDFDQPRIRKVYQLSLSDDPAGIPTEDFEEYGMTFHLMEMTRKTEVGVETQSLTRTVTTDSKTGDLGEILKQLDAEIEAETEGGYAGVLKLDYNSVQVEAKGYGTSTRSLSASRTYPNLSNADLSLVPKTVTEGGRMLNLADVKWSSTTDMEGEDVVTRYTATASYTGSVSSRYVTGYTVTADYTGEVAKTSREVVTYTAIFRCTDVPYHNTVPTQGDCNPGGEGQDAPEDGPTESNSPENSSLANGNTATDTAAPSGGSAALSIAGCVGGVAALLAAAYWGFEKIKETPSTKTMRKLSSATAPASCFWAARSGAP